MSSRDGVRNVVFVGNLPHEATEQQLIAEFSKAGTVLSFRVMRERDSGKSKGFGFCEFTDVDTAKSAVRALDKVELMGRTLRVMMADDENQKATSEAIDDDEASSGFGPKPLSAEDQADVVANAVDMLTHQQRVEFLAQMRVFMQQHPHHASALLLQNPSLAQLLLHLEVLFDLVKRPDIDFVTAHQQQMFPVPAPAITSLQPIPSTHQPPALPLKTSSSSTPAAPVLPTVKSESAPVVMRPPMPPPSVISTSSSSSAPLPPQMPIPPQPPILSSSTSMSSSSASSNISTPQQQPPQQQAAVDHARFAAMASALGLNAQQQQVMFHCLQMSPQELSRLPPQVQEQVRMLSEKLRAAAAPTR